MSGGHVLVVEDSPVTRALLVRTLSRAGFLVREATDGAAGALAALSSPPDVVVTDLEMPIMDGYQLVRLLKSDPATERVPVIILTSHGDAPSRFWGYRTGADRYLTKDQAASEIAEVVRSLLSDGSPAPVMAETAPRSATEILGRVARQLDTTLLRTTFVNTLLERGIAASDFHETIRTGLATVSEVVDAHVIGVGIAEAQLVTVHLLAPRPAAEQTLEAIAKRLLDALPAMPGTPVEVVVHGERDAPQAVPIEDLFTLDLELHDAAGRLVILPRSRHEYQESSQHLVEASARHLGLVLDNARLAQRLRELSMLDGLTRLFNHRAIHERLVAEIKRAHRYDGVLAVVICDLDHFKLVNDRHGHLAGDAVLQAAARAMRQALRAGDSLGRFGGEEFLAVLPEADLEAARRAAERLRAAVAGEAVPLPAGGQVAVTASFGAAALPELAGEVTADALIALADTRLYEAKAAGRNCVRP